MAQLQLVKVIINAHSGFEEKEGISRQLTEIFKQSGIAFDISLAHNGAEVADLARAAARAHWQVIVAGGGDGTVNAVASEIVGSDKILGVLPLGTLNHFAKDLGIPNEVGPATRTIISGRTIAVDVGEINGRIFLNNSSLGLYPTIVREREKQQKLGSGKWPAYLWAAFAALRRYPFLDLSLSADGKEFHRRTPFVFVGNNAYAMEAFNIGSRQCLDRGQLCLYVTHRTGRWGLVRLAVRALLGRLCEDKDFLALSTNEAKIETRRQRQRVAFDGEVDIMQTPFHYRVRPRALRVIVPAHEEV